MKRIIAVWLVMLIVMGGMVGIVNLSADAEIGNRDAGIRFASQPKSGLTAHEQISTEGNNDFTSVAPEHKSPDAPTTVLVELFTATWCQYCQGAEGALDRLGDEYSRSNLTIIEWHNEDDYTPVDDSGTVREDFYGVSAFPTAYFDGIGRVVGGSSDPDDEEVYNNYKEVIDNRLNTSSPLIISGIGRLNDSAVIINVEVEAIESISESNLYVHFVLYEDHNETVYVDGREYRLRYTALKSTEQPISIGMGDTVPLHESFTLMPEWNRSKIGVVTFVQTHNKESHIGGIPPSQYYTAEVLQAYDLEMLMSHAPIYIDGNADFSDADDDGVSNPDALGTQDNPYIIENWDINANTANGIEVRNTTVYFIIRNCVIHDGYYAYDGIYFYNVQYGKIETCEIYNNYAGIEFWYSSNNILRNNTLENNTYNLGVRGQATYEFYQDIDITNTINNKPVYYIINQSNLVFEGLDVGYLGLVSCSNITVKNLTLINNHQGLLLVNTSHSTITTNQIYNNYLGIDLPYSSNNNITANQIYNTHVGIYLEPSSNNNVITANQIYNNYGGIDLEEYSNNNVITANQIYDNDWAIHLRYSSNNNITYNQIYNNIHGIYHDYRSSSNEIHYNNIYNNTNYGVYNYNDELQYIANATYNWWGSLNGPGQDGANPVSLNVLYNPWLTEPWTGEEVNQPPVADFTYSPALIVSTTGRIINFMDLSYDPDGNITAWFWGFGDNNTSILQNPTHQYLVAGNYTVNLTVTDDDDATNTTSKQVTIFGFIITNISLTNFTILNLTYLNISYIVNITNAIIINISCINITNLMNITNVSLINVSYINVTNLMNISNMSFANVFEVTLTNFTYMSSSSFINVSYVNITQSMGINNLMFNNVGYAHLQNVTNVNFVITAILNIITIAYENLQMVIPAEALNLSMPFNLSASSASLPPGYDVVGDIYRIECGVSTGAPISITLSYAGIVLPPGISEDDLAVYKKVGDNWIKIDSVIDKLNDTVSVQVTSFSDYAILYKQPSTEDGEESKPSAKPFEIPWLYIIIPIIIIILVVTGMGIKRGKKTLPPEKPTG